MINVSNDGMMAVVQFFTKVTYLLTYLVTEQIIEMLSHLKIVGFNHLFLINTIHY